MSRHVRNATLGFVLVCALGTGCGGDDTSAAAASKGNAAAGGTAVNTRACATCHTGTKGLLAGRDMAITGPNITPDKTTGIGEWTEAQIVKAILTGVDDEGEPLCATMYRYGTMGMTETEAHDIAAYLKSIPAVSNVSKPACP